MVNLIDRSVKFFIGFILIAGFMLLTGCDNSSGGTEVGNPPQQVGEPSQMTTFGSDAELEIYLKDQYARSVQPENIYYGGGLMTLDVQGNASPMESVIDVGDAFSSTDSNTGSFSHTNIQVSGVDESDKVKTDGEYLYVMGDSRVTIVRADPPDEMAVVSIIDINGTVDSLYLHKQILIILYVPEGGNGISSDNVWSMTGMSYWININTSTGVMMVDVKNPSKPVTIQNVVAEGSLISSRIINDKLHVIQQFLPELPPLKVYYDGTEENQLETIHANMETLSAMTLDNLLPSYTAFDVSGDIAQRGRTILSQNFYRPYEPGGGSIVSLISFNLGNLSQPFQSIGIVADAHVVYASMASMYLAATHTADMDQVDDDYNSVNLKTVIHKVDISGEKAFSRGSGSVKGQVLNQFSLDEYDNILRIATTTGIGGNTWKNHVFCLKSGEVGLETIGGIEDIAPGEKIYSARFLGTRGFLVTFRLVDPLFTFDLSDPTAPKVVGELKIPGYSDYIHPLGENHLLTIGKDADEQSGAYQGMQLSIFDIADFSKPVLLHNELIGDRGTESEALHNHKAFTFWAENDLLAIPVSLLEYQTHQYSVWESGTHTFTGLYIYKVKVENGFEFLGRISTGPATSNTYYYSNEWTRGIFIDDSVYAVQSSSVKSADIMDISNDIRVIYLQ